VALRGILDCLDGALARKCETNSSLGAKLDIINDTSALIAVVAVVFIKLISTKYYFVLILLMILVFRLIHASFDTLSGRDVVRDHPIIKYFHDNTVINAIVFAILLHYGLKALKN
jgi:phosphatidylglycerophosphate synthase